MNCGRSSSVEWKLPKLQRRVRFPSPAPFSAWPRAGRFCYAPLRARVRMRMRMRMRIGYRHADRLISYPDAHNLSVKQQPIRAHRQGCNDAVGVKGAGGTGGPGRGAGGRRQGLAGLRGDAPSEARSADGSRAGRRPRAQPAARPSKAHQPAPGTPAVSQATRTGRPPPTGTHSGRARRTKRAAARQGRRAFTQLVHTLDAVESWGHSTQSRGRAFSTVAQPRPRRPGPR